MSDVKESMEMMKSMMNSPRSRYRPYLKNHCFLNNTTNDHPITKPLLVIVQGDPVAERGISAITPLVANLLNVPRGLVCIDPHLNPYHSKNADRDNVVLGTRFTDLVDVLETSRGEGTIVEIEHAVDRLLTLKNEQRRVMDKPPLKDYFREFVLLQEVTKGACRELCGDITVLHTAKTISEFPRLVFMRLDWN